MGLGTWHKRNSEKIKQALGLKGGVKNGIIWKPTPNDRNEAMIGDARKFSKHLKTLHRQINTLQRDIEGGYTTFNTVLNASLPRVYEMSDTGAIAVEKATSIVGTGVNFEVLTASAADLKMKLQNEVLHPLEQWLAAYRSIKQRNRKCEEIRLELDAKRRLAGNMQVSFERQKTKSGGGAAPVPPPVPTQQGLEAVKSLNDTGHQKLEHAEYKLQTEEDKVNRLSQRFTDVEEEVFTALKHLIADTSVLKQYAAASLLVYEGSFRSAYDAFDLSTPNPGASLLNADIKTSMGGTPLPGDNGASGSHPAAPPSWYQDAKQNVPAMNYDSDDETK